MNFSTSSMLLGQGFALVGGMIIALGPQNLFVLRQGLQRRHRFAIATTCTFCDILLITAGLGGLNVSIVQDQALLNVASWVGFLFLLYCGGRSFYAAFTCPSPVICADEGDKKRLREILTATLAVSLLNPSAYLETVMLVGGVGGQYPVTERLFFGAGAMCASTVWFFCLSYGATWLTPLFRHSVAGRRLELLSGTIMGRLAALWFW